MTKHPYQTRAGVTQYKPSADDLESAVRDDASMGFCLACGTWTDGVEPDARKYTCESCNAPKVYGAEELLMMGLYAS